MDLNASSVAITGAAQVTAECGYRVELYNLSLDNAVGAANEEFQAELAELRGKTPTRFSIG